MKTILVAVDNAPSARQVLREAGELARATGARLVLFRAGNVPLEMEAARSHEGRRFSERILEEVRRDLEAMRSEVPAGVPLTLRTDPGPAARAVCEAASAEQADLVVVGSHGQGQRSGRLGLIASQVLAEAGRSVLVVHVPG